MLDPTLRSHLESLTFDGRAAKLPNVQLPRAEYDQLNDAFDRIGGKWNKKTRVHDFPFEPAPLIRAMLDMDALPEKNPTAYFPTPEPIAALLVDMIDWPGLPRTDGVLRVLEPSAGQGALLDAVVARVDEYYDRDDFIRTYKPTLAVEAVEILDANRGVLKAKGYRLVARDFIKYHPPITEDGYGLIVMNPPFDNDAWAKHFLRAWDMLATGGQIVCIGAPNLKHRNTGPVQQVAEILGAYDSTVDETQPGDFKDSGTMIGTVYFRVVKETEPWKLGERQGHPDYHKWVLALYASQEPDVMNQPTADGIRRVVAERRKDLEFLRASEEDVAYALDYLVNY